MTDYDRVAFTAAIAALDRAAPKLPELPEAADYVQVYVDERTAERRQPCASYYTAAQMRAYALASDTGGGAVAWLHEVAADDGEPDQALSFSRDSFPLEGVAGYRTVSVRPLVYGDALRAQPAVVGARGEVAAWARDSGDPNDDAFVISAKVKRLWLASNPKRVARYTRPLYSTHVPCWALPAVESALSIMDLQGYWHSDLAAFRDWLKEKSA